MAGAAIQWLRDGLAIISSSSESESRAKQVNDCDGVYVVPVSYTHLDVYKRQGLYGIWVCFILAETIAAIVAYLLYLRIRKTDPILSRNWEAA